jgi:hypothetical protein
MERAQHSWYFRLDVGCCWRGARSSWGGFPRTIRVLAVQIACRACRVLDVEYQIYLLAHCSCNIIREQRGLHPSLFCGQTSLDMNRGGAGHLKAVFSVVLHHILLLVEGTHHVTERSTCFKVCGLRVD